MCVTLNDDLRLGVAEHVFTTVIIQDKTNSTLQELLKNEQCMTDSDLDSIFYSVIAES